MLAARPHEVLGLHRESEPAETVGATRAQVSACLVRCRGRGAFEFLDRFVDLRGHARTSLRLVRLSLREHELPGQLRRGDGGKYRPPPARHVPLPPGPRDEEGDEDHREHDDDGE